MLDPSSPIGPKKIKPQAVIAFINLIDQILAQHGPLGRVYDAFKDGILHALSVVFAHLGHTAQASRAFVVFHGNVITY
jgi:hypothetical protein